MDRVEDGEEVEYGCRGGAVGEERQGPGGSQQAEEPHRHQGHLPGLAVLMYHPRALQAAAFLGHHPKDSHIEEEDEAEVAAVGDIVDQEIFGSDPAPEKETTAVPPAALLAPAAPVGPSPGGRFWGCRDTLVHMGGLFQGQGEAGGPVGQICCPCVAQLGGSLRKLQVDLACPSVTWRPAGMMEQAQHKRWWWWWLPQL